MSPIKTAGGLTNGFPTLFVAHSQIQIFWGRRPLTSPWYLLHLAVQHVWYFHLPFWVGFPFRTPEPWMNKTGIFFALLAPYQLLHPAVTPGDCTTRRLRPKRGVKLMKRSVDRTRTHRAKSCFACLSAQKASKCHMNHHEPYPGWLLTNGVFEGVCIYQHIYIYIYTANICIPW